MKKLLALTLALTLTLAGCASTNTGSSTQPPSPSTKVETTLATTDTIVVALGHTFAAVSAVFTEKCKAKVYTVQTCTDYRLFGEKFKVAYAAYSKDGPTQSVMDAIQKLVVIFGPYLIMSGVK